MFELEFINLINEYKKSKEEYEKNKIKTSISNLIKENTQEYNKFCQLQPLDDEAKKLLSECEENNKKTADQEHQNAINAEDDFEIIKSYYYKWLEIYNQNNKEVNNRNTLIVKEIIEHYVRHRFEVLEKIFNLNEDEDFENFKWHIKNELRIYFISKIKNYLESNNYKQLNFFMKIKKQMQLNKELNELGEYKFNLEKLERLLQ